nr:hypothetical protein [Haloquadratum walsbyi]
MYQRGTACDYYDLYQPLETDSVTIDFADVEPAFDAKFKHDGIIIDLTDGLPAEGRRRIPASSTHDGATSQSRSGGSDG